MAEKEMKTNTTTTQRTAHCEAEATTLARLQSERDDALQAAAAAHAQLRSSEELLLGVLSSSLDGICLLEERKVYFVNPRLCEMLGCDADVLLGNDFTAFVAGEDLVRTQQMYRRMMRSSAFPHRYETVLVVPGGEQIEVVIHADMVRFHGRDSLMLRVRDISAHRQARKMAVENERLEAVLTVAHSVGSNFANALSIIRNQAATIADSFLPSTRLYEAAHQVLESAEHAAELTKRLLSVVRMSGSDASVHIEPVWLNVSLQKARDLLHAGLEERDVRLVIAPDPRPWYVLADAGHLLDVLMNLFLHAADAMTQGGTIQVDIRAETRESKDMSGDPARQEFVCVMVRDEGEGMSPEDIAKVFEPFYRSRKNRSGFGLGLPVAQQMLKRWGGELAISSVMGKGTIVSLFLPKATDFDPGKDGLHGDGFDGRTLLVVEDHAERRRMMVEVLQAEGFRVLEADNGDQAIDLYQANTEQIALTILDWMLPGADGGVVLQTIQDYDPDARIILISGFSRDYVRSHIKRGAWAFLQKPFSGEDLLASVQRTLPAPRCLLPAPAEG